jgi:hypothetical protein
MIEEFEYKGIWWLPDKPEKQISGTLRFTPNEGGVLELMSSFKDIQVEPEIILGVSSNGKNITLHKCFDTKTNFNFPGFLTSSFYANVIFIGAHFQKLEDIKFKSISIHYSHLDEWVNISGFNIKPPGEEKELIIKYKLPEPIKADVSNVLKVLINIRATESSPSFVQKEATIKQETEIKIETSEDKSFEDYRRIMYHIQNFLTLGITEPVHPLAIAGLTGVNKEMIEDKVNYPPVEIFYRLSDIPKSHKPLHPFDMLFTFKDISNSFESFLRNWFEKEDLLEPVYNLYFGTLYNPRMYLEHRFLSLIQAIESFHQRTYGGEYSSDEDYKVVYDALVNSIPEGVRSGLKDRLKEYLKYGNEFSLRKRLKEIFDKNQEILDGHIGNKKAFIEKVVDTRNYQTHHDEELKERAASGEDLYRLIQKLKLLLEICLLTELGFTSEKIKALFFKKYKMST